MAESVTVIALRGALHAAPENTVPAIKEAVKAGVDIVALDVQPTSDHVPILIGDTRVDRVTNGQGKVTQLALKEIQALDAGSWFDAKFKGTSVATLEDGLAALGKKTRGMFILPQVDAASAFGGNLLAQLKCRAGSGDLLVCPDSGTLKALREKAPDFEYVLALDEKVDGWLHIEKARSLKLNFIRPHTRQLNAKLVGNAHGKKLKVYAHFADEADEMAELIEMKVDGIVTGRPERLQELLAGAKK